MERNSTEATGESLPWSVEKRLAFIHQRLLWEGRINRADLVSHFGISPNQATADLKRFEGIYPQGLIYDTRAKLYRAGPGLGAPADGEALDLLRELRLIAEGVMPQGILAALPSLGLAEAPLRRVDPTMLQLSLIAIREGRVLSAVYQSFSSPEPRRRRLSPHALVFDGFRWHLRAGDEDSRDFKDFVLGRLSAADIMGPASLIAEQDDDWRQMVTLIYAPHPGLAPHQRAVIATDYGMVGGLGHVHCRKAVEYYVRRRLGLIAGHETLPANEQQIVLLPSNIK